MTDEELAIDSVTIQRAPGFEAGGFSIEELSSGVNVVHGPNAAGKTTLAKAVQSMLWPGTADERSTLVGQFSLDGDDWRVDVAAQQARHQQNGMESNGPNLPSPTHHDRYRLSLHDLLQHETRNEPFAKQIQQESIGGYDLDAAYDALGFDDSPSTRRISEYKTATDAREACQSAKRDLEAFSERLADVDGTEAERIKKLNERIQTEQAEIQKAEATKEEAETTLADVDLPEEGVSLGFIDQLKAYRDDLKSLEEKRERLDRDLSRARQRRAEARSDIPFDIDDDTLAELEPAAWETVAEFVERAEALQADRKAHAAVQKWLTNGEDPEADLSTLEDGRRALENWLSAPPEAGAGAEVAFRTAAVSAGVVGLTGVALGALVHPGFVALLVVALGLFWYGYRARDEGSDGADDRASARHAFERLSLDAPREWGEDAVRTRLTGIYTDIADAHLANERTERREALTDNLDDLEERATALEEQRAQLRDEYGVAPETSDTQLAATTKGVLRWQDAHDDVVGTEAEIDRIEDQIETKRTRLEEELAPYGYDAVPDAATATQYIRDLEGRREQHKDATNKREQAEATLETSREELDALTKQRESVFTELGLDVGDEERLRELCDQVDAYEEAKTTVEQKRSIRDREADALEEYPDFEPELKTQSVPELEAAKQDAQETADDYDRINEEITAIKTKVDEAKRESEFEDATAEKRRALDALEERLEADTAAMVGDVLVDHVREATQETNRPAVFENARELLTRITMGRYRLDLDENTFRAYDTVKERGFALDELSSATRLQVLLAVRLAFVEQQEQGVKLPLLLDETLANTDDRRADAIIDAVVELARAGRQVFYFTAQGDAVAKWQQALVDAGDVESTTVDLGAITDHDDHVDVPEFDDLLPTEASLPDPADHDHATYGEALGVPSFSPRKGAGSAHVWYVVEDTELLHHLLELDIERWGQLKELLERTDGTIITEDEAMLEAIRGNGAAIEEFVKSWEVGRGTRVDRQVLEGTSAVTDKFIDEVAELARDLDGDGEAIVEALRDGAVDRFHRSKMDELEDYFEANGYIQDRDTLPPETIRTRVVSRLSNIGSPRAEARERAFALFKRLQSHRATPPA